MTVEPPTSDRLYHYTDANALMNILNPPSGPSVLRASEAIFLNDSQELTFALQHLAKQLDSFAAELPADARADDEPPSAESYWKAVALKTSAGLSRLLDDDLNTLRAFVSCFCKDGDLLSQWRSYGRGGFSIGFDPAMLQNLTPAGYDPPETSNRYLLFGPTVRLEQVRYVSDADKSVDDSIVTTILPPTHHPAHGGMDIILSEREAIYQLCQIKHFAFHEEQESRLIYVARREDRGDGSEDSRYRPSVQFRSGPLTVVPYIELIFDPVAIKEIYVGPGGEQELRLKAIKRFLHEINRDDIELKLSDAHYRSA